jgi:hypothetical protein
MARPTENPRLWRKSSYTTNENCVELSFAADAVAVRDSKDPEGPRLNFTPSAFARFLTATRQNRLAPTR